MQSTPGALNDMKLNRLRSMGAAELAVRGRQEIAKRLERAGMLGRPSSPPYGMREAGRAHFARFQEAGFATFFAGADSDAARDLLLRRLPCDQKLLLMVANDVREGRFDLLGYRELSFGDPIDWHLDPVSGHRAPREHWSLIDPLDRASVGDSKVTWELNRHQWLVNLGQAYRLTGEERYAECFAARVGEWLRANPRGIGINWASSLEVALRLISWCWALTLFRRSKALSAPLFVDMLESLHAHACHVEQYLSSYFSPNTHLTGEALGLLYAGVVLPQCGDAARWRTLGRRLLEEQIGRQVLADGVYFEQSTYYQRYTVEIYLHYLILAQRSGMPVPPVVRERVQRMLDCLLAMRLPNGSMPQIGDADGGSLLPFTYRPARNFRGVFAVGAALFARPDYAWAAGGVAPEILWLLGSEGCEAFDALRPAPPVDTPSRAYRDSGYAVMRDAWKPDSHQLILDAGPLGCPVSGGHGHADLLGVQCAVFGEPCIVDPGTYSYADTRWRNHFRGTAAHSTVRIDGQDHAVPAGPFRWEQRPGARLRRWVSTDTFDLADADHDAYRGLTDPVTHRRRVFFAKPGYWLLVDDLDGGAEHRVELKFQFAPLDVVLDPDGRARARLAEGRELRVLAFARTPLQARLVKGGQHPIQGWVSPDYGRLEPAPALTYSTTAVLPLRVLTLLLPVDPAAAPPPTVTLAPGHDRLELAFADRHETLHIGEQDIVLDRG